MAARQLSALHPPNTVTTHFEWSPGRFTRIQLPQASGCSIARVDEGFLTRFARSIVQGVKSGARHVDLSANFQQVGKAFAA